MQAISWGHSEVRAAPDRLGTDGPATRVALLSHEAAEAVDALFGPWEQQLEASVRRLSALGRDLPFASNRTRRNRTWPSSA